MSAQDSGPGPNGSGEPRRHRPAGAAYLPELDGVRGLAVAAVLAFHGGVVWLRGGFLGVDAFFVLSGFLITSLLLAEHRRTGRIRLVAFWGRRARRLLPALLLLLVTVVATAPWLLPPTELAMLRADAFGALGYLANWRMSYRGTGLVAGPGSCRITIFGDSVSWSLGAYLPPHPGLKVSDRGVQGCGISPVRDIRYIGFLHHPYPGCDRWASRWHRGMLRDDPDVAVILLDRWELMDAKPHGVWVHVGQPGYDAWLAGQLRKSISVVGERGATVVLLTAPYTRRMERPDGGLFPEDTPARVDAWNRLLRAVAAETGARVLDLNRVICPDGRFTWAIDGLQVRSDGLHFTPAGVQRVIAPWLLPRLARIATSAAEPNRPDRSRH